MAQFDVGSVLVLRCPFSSVADAFDRDEEGKATAGWDLFVGANEARFAAKEQGDATLLMPRVAFDDAQELAVYLRATLGDVLDAHDDERGVACLSSAPEEERAGYESLVKGEIEWLERIAKDDARMNKEAGWAFGAAAKGLQTDGSVVERVSAQAQEDPLQQAGDKLGEAADKREDRSSMRRSLGGAVGSSFLDSPLAKKAPDKPGLDDLGKKRSGLGDGLKSDGDRVAELESTLREAVEGDVAEAVGDMGAGKPPASSGEKKETEE